MINQNTLRVAYFAGLTILIGACAGPTVLPESQPVARDAPLAVFADTAVVASLDWVTVRNGPGAWARDANWDEYLLQIHNHADATVTVTDVQLVDSMQTPIDPRGSASGLANASRDVARRHSSAGVVTAPGVGAETLFAAGAVASQIGYGVGLSYAALSSIGLTSTASALFTSSVVLSGPALLLTANERQKDERALAHEIGARQTPLPTTIQPGRGHTINLFFPITPSPQSVRVRYTSDGEDGEVMLDTSGVLGALNVQAEP